MHVSDFEIIDCHIHPPVSDAADLTWFYPVESLDAFVADMRGMGIDRACGSVIARGEIDSFAPVAAMNKTALELQDRFPDFYIPAMHIDPRYPDESCAELELYVKEKGVRWVGELVGYMMGYQGDYLPPGCEPIYELATELGVCIDFHCGDLEMIDRMCTAFPKLNFALAHPEASQGPFKARLELVTRHPNLHLDLSGSGVMRWDLIRYAVEKAGAEKLLFGSDFPICNPAMYIHCVMTEHISDKEREAIFSGNFKRLIGMS